MVDCWPVPVKYAGIMARARSGTATRAGAIKARCIECTGYDRSLAVDCCVPDCPLYKYNPYRRQNARRRAATTVGSVSGEERPVARLRCLPTTIDPPNGLNSEMGQGGKP